MSGLSLVAFVSSSIMWRTVAISHGRQTLRTYSMNGCQVARVDDLAAALGCSCVWNQSHMFVQLQKGSSRESFALGSYLAFTPQAAVMLPRPLVRRMNVWYVPLKCVGQTFCASLNPEGTSLRTSENVQVEVLNGPVPKRRGTAMSLFLGELEDASIDFQQTGPYAMKGEEVAKLRVFTAQTAQPMVPVLTKLSNSRLLHLAGHIPGLGIGASVVSDAAGASVELLAALNRMNQFDATYQAPIRRMVLACAKVQRTKRVGDVGGAVQSLISVRPALTAYQLAAKRADRAIDRLQRIGPKLKQIITATGDGPAIANGTGVGTSLTNARKWIDALSWQARDVQAFTVVAAKRGKRAE